MKKLLQGALPYMGEKDRNGVANGLGMLKNADGSVYMGKFLNGKRHGMGTLKNH